MIGVKHLSDLMPYSLVTRLFIGLRSIAGYEFDYIYH